MPTADEPSVEEIWRDVLTGAHPGLRRGRRLFALLPSDPRCRLCNAPFQGFGGTLVRLIGKRRSSITPSMCNFCEDFAAKHRGGAEVEITMFFADVRDSTGLAERMSASNYGRLIDRFYSTAVQILVDRGAALDKLVGDAVVAHFIPGFAGPDHAATAVRAAGALLRAVGYGERTQPWLPIGIGIHTGVAFVGILGGAAATTTDFTALGDSVNVTARLASKAAAGEILVSDVTYAAAALDVTGAEKRSLDLKGKSEPVDVHVLHADSV